MIRWSVEGTSGAESEAAPTFRSLGLGECGSGLRPRRDVENHLGNTPLELDTWNLEGARSALPLLARV